MRSCAPKLKGGFAPWRLAPEGVSFLKLPLDTVARTLLAWLGIMTGFPRLHEHPLSSYLNPVTAGGIGAGSNAPREPPVGAVLLYERETAFTAVGERKNGKQ